MNRKTEELEEIIGYHFKNKHYLTQALTHSSYANEKKLGKLGSNERLEFLGDAVLELISSDYLYARFTQIPEGELTKKRASLVCEPSLAYCAREFGLPQARERVFTISCLNGEKFDFTSLIRTPMRKISEFLEDNENVPEVYNVTQPSVYNVIGASGIKRATVIKDFAYTITTRQDRTPAQVIDCGSGRYRYLTERECWRLMGYTDEEFEAAKAVHERKGRYYMTLYKQAGNSIAVPIFESIFRKIILGEEKNKEG